MSGVIFVTHDLPALRTAANSIAVMYQGKVVELGPTEIVVERPEHPLEQGQVTCIVGESGSGKSTIARMVLGLMPITSGKLIFQGNDVTNLKGRARAEYWRDVQAVFGETV